ncbi:hypothetical protein Xmau_03115 [Xenorhabdus mauleonii]|uniref:Uncharacterized protein n=2 Tax=Xenorhabdus mauleonii TaxID=351675 RepID=A0A1I3SMI8_9GAMM|nr:hypothetical protein Xmau_03115 [Xenorhabdus mauleonii]SFJ58831.1 hypothetical protein SAMN05421680_111136 [Xenorhabdus mauleonii]
MDYIKGKTSHLGERYSDIAERDNRLIALEASQKRLENEIKQQQKESYRAIEQFKTLLAHAQCGNCQHSWHH